MRSAITLLLLAISSNILAQTNAPKVRWIRPDAKTYQNTWGIENGIVFSLWPAGVETGDQGTGGPRGLLRMGYAYQGKVYLINFIAIEPVVEGKIEFSEISPSHIDGKWGKILWASDTETADAYNPATISRGVISHPDANRPEVEELSLFVFTEQYFHQANPYFKISIRSDKPEEICFQIFNKDNSAKMDRCALTATMGNYSRLRKLYFNDGIVDSRTLYKDYNGIDFIEKDPYPANRLLKLKDGSLIAIAAPNETFSQLSAWPSDSLYNAKRGWRYRAPVKFTQFWRKAPKDFDPSLEVRVNGRAKYWAVASRDPKQYVEIPGGPAFENFELREKYHTGQKFYYGISHKTPEEIVKE